MNLKKKEILLFFGLVLGFLFVTQGKSMFDAKESIIRDSGSSVFQEIKILKDKNKALSKEVEELTNNLSDLSDMDLAVEAIKQDIEKFKKLSGKYPIFGSGVEVIISAQIQVPFIIDLVNELYNSGASAVSINGIRLSNLTSGIDVMPNGQLFIDSFVLSSPYKISALGDSKTITDILYASGGIVDRIKKTNPGLDIIVQSKDIIQMN